MIIEPLGGLRLPAHHLVPASTFQVQDPVLPDSSTVTTPNGPRVQPSGYPASTRWKSW